MCTVVPAPPLSMVKAGYRAQTRNLRPSGVATAAATAGCAGRPAGHARTLAGLDVRVGEPAEHAVKQALELIRSRAWKGGANSAGRATGS